MFTSIIELKCKFCHRINRLYGIDGKVQERIMRYTLLLDVLNGIHIVEVSPSASEILGYSKEELLSMTANDIDPILGSGGYDHLWHSRFQGFRKGFRINSVQRKKNGKLIPVQALVKFIFTDLRTGSLWSDTSFVLPDLPALKEQRSSASLKFPALQELVRSLWRRTGILPYAYIVLDCFEDVVALPTRLAESKRAGRAATSKLTGHTPQHFSLSADLDGTCIYVTPSVEYVLGYTQAEMLGNFIFDYFAPKDRAKYRAKFFASVQTHSSFRATIRFYHKSKDQISCETCFLPRQDDSGMLGYYEGVCWR